MPNPYARPLAAALLLLLPIFGAGEQAQAGFVADSVLEIEVPDETSWDSVVTAFMCGDGPTCTLSEPAEPRLATVPQPPTPGQSRRRALTDRAGATTTSPDEPCGHGFAFGPARRLPSPVATTAALLVARVDYPVGVASRLFRPPRSPDVLSTSSA